MYPDSLWCSQGCLHLATFSTLSGDNETVKDTAFQLEHRGLGPSYRRSAFIVGGRMLTTNHLLENDKLYGFIIKGSQTLQ